MQVSEKKIIQRPGFGLISRGLGSLSVLGVIFFVFVTTFPPFEAATEVNLPLHMAQHVLIAIAGVMIAYPLYRAGKFDRIKSARAGFAGLAFVAAFLVFWHLPTYWDAAVLNPAVHIAEHFCFLAIGISIGAFIPMLSDNFKMLCVVMAISSHMFYGFALFITTTPIYPLYPVAQQQALGVWLFAPSPVYLVGFLYITLTRESRKLESQSATSKDHLRHRGKVARFVIPTLAVLLLVVLGGYLTMTEVTISSAQVSSSPNQAIVYIEETPITWQYSPQNITLVMGVNNTVTWVSHSLTYDTVTSNNGTFSSTLQPGQSFKFTFQAPGIYPYYCEFHPWMHGVVRVLA